MDVITAARELGKAIQADERFVALMAAKDKNDADEKLNELIGKLNLVQMSYQHEAEGEADEAKMKEYDSQFRELYGEIMTNENMKNYEFARGEVDDMMNYIMELLSLCVNGEDPDTCEPKSKDAGCTGSCGTCGGCG